MVAYRNPDETSMIPAERDFAWVCAVPDNAGGGALMAGCELLTTAEMAKRYSKGELDPRVA